MDWCFILFLIYIALNISVVIGLYISNILKRLTSSKNSRIFMYLLALFFGIPLLLAFFVFIYTKAALVEILLKNKNRSKDE